MKRATIFLAGMVFCASSAGYAMDYASQYGQTGSESKTSGVQPAAEMGEEKAPAVIASTDALILSRQLNDLEMRIANLERENRFQEERARRLDRTIMDLKRRT